MNDQTAWDFSIVTPEGPVERVLSPRERFEQFHAANPQVFAWLRRMALEQKRDGRKVGIRLLWERLRWDIATSTQSADANKLNNDYTRHFSRLLMEKEPELAGYFEIRERAGISRRAKETGVAG